MNPLRVVVIGFGPVAARFIEELLPHVRQGAVHLTVLGAEAHMAYNRVLIGDYAVGRVDQNLMRMLDATELTDLGVTLQLGTTVTHIDRITKQVITDSENSIAYDQLVLATGARALLPNVTGINPSAKKFLPLGIGTLRDYDDATRLAAAVTDRAKMLVLGGGILGVEAALALADQELDVTILNSGPWILPRSLDSSGGLLLAKQLDSSGIHVQTNARVGGIITKPSQDGTPIFDAVKLSDGRKIHADYLLVSIGVRARTELAEKCGLSVGNGILVDHRLRVHGDPSISAIGDCAEIKCRDAQCAPCLGTTAPSGLIGPGWQQATQLAGQLASEITASLGSSASAEVPGPRIQAPSEPGVVILKSRTVEMCAAGSVDASAWDALNDSSSTLEVAEWADPMHGRYVKMVSEHGVLTGFVCLGMPRTGAELISLFEQGAELPADRSVLFRLDSGFMANSANLVDHGPDSILCRCAGIPRGVVDAAIDAGADTVADVSACTKAGTGCGGCKTQIATMISSAPSMTRTG